MVSLVGFHCGFLMAGQFIHSFNLLIFFCSKIVFFFYAEEELDETLFSTLRYRPEELESLEQSTKFTRKEIQLIYRGFKQVHLELIQ